MPLCTTRQTLQAALLAAGAHDPWRDRINGAAWKDIPDKSGDHAERANIIARFSIWDSIVPDAMLCGNPFATTLSF